MRIFPFAGIILLLSLIGTIISMTFGLEPEATVLGMTLVIGGVIGVGGVIAKYFYKGPLD